MVEVGAGDDDSAQLATSALMKAAPQKHFTRECLERADLDDSFRKAGGAIPVIVANLPPSADV